MERKFNISCSKGHPSYKLCCFRSCPHPAAICEQQQCQCHQLHSKCFSQIVLSKLQHIFDEKDIDSQKEADEIILTNINKMIEDLQILREEYYEGGKCSFEYKYNNKQLYKILKEGNTLQIKPETLQNFLQQINLKKKREREGQSQNRDIKRLKKMMSDILETHQKSIQQIKQFWKGIVNFRFDQKLCNPRDYQLEDNNKIIFTVPTLNTHAALVSPSLIKSSKLKFKILRHQNFSVGVARKAQESLRRQTYTDFYSVSSIGRNWNGPNGNFQCKYRNDVIQVEYIRESQQVKVTNLTNKTTHTLHNITEGPGNLHFAVLPVRAYFKIKIIE